MHEITKVRYGSVDGQPATITETWRVTQVARPVIDGNGKPTGELSLEEEAFLVSSAGADPKRFEESDAVAHSHLLARTAHDVEATRREVEQALAAQPAGNPVRDAAVAEAREKGLEALASFLEAL